MKRLDELLTFFHEREEIQQHGFKLPHWQQPGACYFVTFRLADSIPKSKLDQWGEERVAWLNRHPKPWSSKVEREYHLQFSDQFEKWCDAGYGACVLREPAAAEILAETLGFYDPARYVHYCWVIMPNHVHVLFSLHPDRSLEKELKSWKGVSARRINEALGREGTLWQRNYFDQLIRDADHFRKVARYIRRNPEKAGLREDEYRLYESELVMEVMR